MSFLAEDGFENIESYCQMEYRATDRQTWQAHDGEGQAVTHEANCNFIFVYGTLRKDAGHELFHVLARNAAFVGEAVVRGRLFNLGSYPGVVLSDDPAESVKGELYEIAQSKQKAVLDLLDHYEGCAPDDREPHEYRRELVDVSTTPGATVQAWVYLLNRPTDRLEPIASGDYLAWRASSGA